jgi:hypothetical protein
LAASAASCACSAARRAAPAARSAARHASSSRDVSSATWPSKRFPLLQDIDPEEIRAQAKADGHIVLVTDDHLRVGSGDLTQLDLPIEGVRRIQFDIERERPATLVIVPDAPSIEPVVVMVLPEEYEHVSHALAVLGMKMAALAN